MLFQHNHKCLLALKNKIQYDTPLSRVNYIPLCKVVWIRIMQTDNAKRIFN